ncbi:DUF4097 family beta strand repeat-containing protein [Algoriphagus sp.]|jgi:hypothetical protein|uniref:DUF4097 family beta strand repeat-containing protein n=1 Tax=Algoriphagus sp. TaxID=1872435 RepID=UPI00271680CC|nr:DUF4097 family beta strand repeat-containing protein [Algoriphagus sp.]MDO8965729.1 DUF4097 family beta strand repeat-containing protein [Algoriphagus sp.]MDP3202422.1 DUF4097 family beta strand repeat-containing protein [Algoriphagus sp.]
MNLLKTTFVITLLVFLSLQLTAFAAEFRVDPYLTKKFTLNGAGNLHVETSGSAFSVTGASGNSVVVDMYVKLDGKEMETENAAVKKELENYTINISQSGNTISLIVKRKNHSMRSKINLSFKIQVPKEMSSKFQSSGGSIAIAGLKGNQDIATSGGSITVLNSEGNLKTRSSGGSFRVENFIGGVEVQTSGGSTKVDGLTGDLIVGSSGGSVNLAAIRGSINVNSSGGSIKAELSSVEKSLSMKSSGGSITAIVPKGLGMNLDLSGGRVNSSLSNFDGEIKKDRILGKINGGGIPVTMHSSGGSINLEFN